MLAQGREVMMARTEAEAERLSKWYGVKGCPLLSYLPSLALPTSFPFDFMHLIWENLIKNLILLWTGEFKGMDTGNESYELHPDVWEAIGKATAASGATIPSAFHIIIAFFTIRASRPTRPNIHVDGSSSAIRPRCCIPFRCII